MDARDDGARAQQSFLDRHHRLLAVTGALIVFITYIVNDVIRDHLKDAVSSLQSARSTYENAKRFKLMQQSLDQIQISVDYPRYLLSTLPKTPAQTFDTERERILQNLASTCRFYTGYIGDAVEFAQEAKADTAAVAQLKRDRDAIAKCASYNPPGVTGHQANQYDADSMAAFNSDVKKMFDVIYSTSNDVIRVQRRILDAAQNRAAKYEQRARWATRGGIGLYGFGWVLGFIGTVGAGKAASD